MDGCWVCRLRYPATALEPRLEEQRDKKLQAWIIPNSTIPLDTEIVHVKWVLHDLFKCVWFRCVWLSFCITAPGRDQMPSSPRDFLWPFQLPSPSPSTSCKPFWLHAAPLVEYYGIYEHISLLLDYKSWFHMSDLPLCLQQTQNGIF